MGVTFAVGAARKLLLVPAELSQEPRAERMVFANNVLYSSDEPHNNAEELDVNTHFNNRKTSRENCLHDNCSKPVIGHKY